MWVRSQDGLSLINVNQVMVEGCRIVCCKWRLGSYETPERAKEVIGELHAHISNYGYNVAIGAGTSNVFRMPEE